MLIDPKLDAIERESFRRYCRHIGRPVAAVEAELLPLIRQVIEERLAYAEVHFPEYARERRALVNRASDYIAVNRVLIDIERPRHIEEVVDAAARLPIHYRHLGGLAAKADVPRPDAGDPESLRRFLERVPTLNLFDQEFNAFVSGDTAFGDIPAVCVFPHLYGSLFGLVDLVLPVILDGSFNYRPLNEVNERASERAFVTACAEALAVIASERMQIDSDQGVPRFSATSGDHMLLAVMTVEGGSTFVWLHEYGHLLMGHLEQGAAPWYEREADEFARVALGEVLAKSRNFASWMVVGVLFMFLAMHVIELRYGNIVSATHPPALERLRRFIAFNEWMQKGADRIAAACSPAARRQWGFEVAL